jgi:hypothetical protein
MSSARSKSIKSRNRSVRRNPLTFSMRQKKKERSEVRKNNASSVMADYLDNCDNNAEGTLPDQSENSIHIEASENLFSKATTLSHHYNSKTLISDTLDMYDLTNIFPYTNKSHETSQKTFAEESKQWESLFDAQHSFGSFQHTISKPVASHQYFYKGKWPLDTKDITGMAPSKHNNNKNATFLFPSVPDPTLPNMEHLEQLVNAPLVQDEEPISLEGSMASIGQIEILPCASLSSFPKYKLGAVENDQSLWKDRLELLNTIQQQGFREEWNGTLSGPNTLSKTARLKRKAEKMKREALMQPTTKDQERNTNDMHRSHLVAMEPDTMHQEDEEHYQSSLASIEEGQDVLYYNKDVEKQIKEVPEIKNRTRLSFLLFAYGFFFPPLWVIGALYSPSIQRTSSCQKIDKKWRKYSRHALFVFMILVAAVVVLLLALKPQSIGFRNSSEGGYQEERVVFDENDSNIAAESIIKI